MFPSLGLRWLQGWHWCMPGMSCVLNHVYSFLRCFCSQQRPVNMPPNTFNNVDNNMKAKLISNSDK